MTWPGSFDTPSGPVLCQQIPDDASSGVLSELEFLASRSSGATSPRFVLSFHRPVSGIFPDTLRNPLIRIHASLVYSLNQGWVPLSSEGEGFVNLSRADRSRWRA